MKHFRKRGRLPWLAWLAPATFMAALAACGGGGGGGSPGVATATSAPAAKPLRSGPVSQALPTKYTPVILSPNGWGYRNAVNASGQVAFNDWDPYTGDTVRFHSAGSTQTVDTSPATTGLTWNRSQGLALSDSGRVAGNSNGATDYERRSIAWSWDSQDATLTRLAPADQFSYPNDQNASGEIVGTASNGPFTWSPAAGLQMLPSSFGWPVSINNSGVMAGYGWNGSSYVARTLTQTGSSAWSVTDLSTPANGESYAYSINSAGTVAGYTRDPSMGSRNQAAIWTAAGRIDLGALPGDSESLAWLVSDSGHVLGDSYGGTWWRSVVWSPTSGMKELGDVAAGKPAYPHLLNKWGHAAGAAYDWNAQYRQYGFVWSETDGLVDLNTRIDNAPPGFHVWNIFSIGDGGHILASTSSGLALLVPGTLSVAPPVVGPISANDPVPVGTSVTVGASFTDPDASDTHTASWSWGDGSAATAGAVTESNGAGSVSGAHSFAAAGVYNVSVTVTDNTGKTATVTRQVVVYDPAAGFVTGGGWIISPAGAYKQDATLAGRATFGFVSKYQKGAVKPSGKTEFQFQAAKLNFHSSDYDWLVVAGARAQYKGTGTINGRPGYKFMLTGVDGQVSGGGGSDRFRIKIWHYDAATETDVVDYDNQLDTSTEGTVNEGTVIGGGSIQIHR